MHLQASRSPSRALIQSAKVLACLLQGSSGSLASCWAAAWASWGGGLLLENTESMALWAIALPPPNAIPATDQTWTQGAQKIVRYAWWLSSHWLHDERDWRKWRKSWRNLARFWLMFETLEPWVASGIQMNSQKLLKLISHQQASECAGQY